jgi:hypothetical protein
MINQILENLSDWEGCYILSTSSYRKQLVSKISYEGIHCKNTNNGYTGIISQKRFSFYKPNNYEIPEGYFGLNEKIKRLYLLSQMEDNTKLIFEQILSLFEHGYVLTNWDTQLVKTFVYLDEQSKTFIENHKDFFFDGHIRVLKHKFPQYDTHKPLKTNSGNFYYSTEYCNSVKPDYDYRFDDELEKNGIYDVIVEEDKTVKAYIEEPLIIE